jgi:catechol 2,3-dioxygenase-like lactoylglutathione lyase family enzyme
VAGTSARVVEDGSTALAEGEEATMRVSFVAGFGPVVRDVESSRAFWGAGLGIDLEKVAPNYWTTEELDGVNAFTLWPLGQAAASCFGTEVWPEEISPPQAWMELDLESADAVVEAVDELEAAGNRVLRGARGEPGGRTTARLLTPEGLLIGITHTPWLHHARASTRRVRVGQESLKWVI